MLSQFRFDARKVWSELDPAAQARVGVLMLDLLAAQELQAMTEDEAVIKAAWDVELDTVNSLESALSGVIYDGALKDDRGLLLLPMSARVPLSGA